VAKNLALKRILSLIVVIGFIAAVFGQACSDLGGAQFNNTVDGYGSLDFSLTPTGQSIAPGATLQLTPNGGEPPYRYVVSSGGGTVSASGLYTAPAAASLTSSGVIVNCTDELGSQASVQISIVGAGVTATYTPNPVGLGTAVTIIISGGTPPYRLQIMSGTGTLNQYTYSAPTTAETAIISIMDSTGIQMNPPLQILVGSGGGGGGTITYSGILQLWASPAFQRIVNPACPAGYTRAGAITDMGGGIGAMQGDQVFCFKTGTTTPGGTYVSSLYVTPGNHSNAGCAAGYTSVGSWPDCNGGWCWANQFLCAKLSTTGATPLQNFYIPEQAYRSQACNSGDTNVGSTVDCYWNSCSGVQNFCVR
jgi:hypothetical protein